MNGSKQCSKCLVVAALCYLLEISAPERQTWKPWAFPRALGFQISEPHKLMGLSHTPYTLCQAYGWLCSSSGTVKMKFIFLLACPVPDTNGPLWKIWIFMGWKIVGYTRKMWCQVWQTASGANLVVWYRYIWGFLIYVKCKNKLERQIWFCLPCSLPF